MLEAIHLACCAYMTGIIWFVQCIHYPSMSTETEHEKYMRTMGLLVGPVMILEMCCQSVLLFTQPDLVVYLCSALLIIVWFSTFLIQVPLHNLLTHGTHSSAQRRLVASNWVRTVAWTARTLILITTF